MTHAVTITSSAAAAAAQHAAAATARGEESCGLIFGEHGWPERFDRFLELENVEPPERRGFAFGVNGMEYNEAFRAELERREAIFVGMLAATFHSHVAARARPTAGDRELLTMWAYNFIYGFGELALWIVYRGEWRQAELVIVDG